MSSDGVEHDAHRSTTDYWHYTPQPPREVTGGIKAQRGTDGFAQKWWGRRWLQVLESFRIGGRLSRGRNYAFSGQVAKLDIAEGTVSATVQGTRSTPYTVTIALKAFGDHDWDRIVQRLADEPGLTSGLLRNELPEGVEKVFRQLKLPLFPQHLNDLKTDCSCPDWSNPCKHIAAVYYLLAEAFNDYPFLLFRLRGIEMDDFLTRLRGIHGGVSDVAQKPEETLPLPADHMLFWRQGDAGDSFLPGVAPPSKYAQLPLRLGAIPFWRSDIAFLDAMQDIYATASRNALALVAMLQTD